MAGFSPEDVTGFEKVRVNGEINGQEYLEEDFYDINEAWNLLNQPLFELLKMQKYGESSTKKNSFGGYGERDDLTQDAQALVDQWDKNKDAEVLIYLEDRQDQKYEFEVVTRDDTSITTTDKPFSFIELKHSPARHKSTAETQFSEVQRLALRNAFTYNQDYLDRTPVGVSEIVPEMDLITAYDREGGLWDQFERSDIPFSQVIRSDFKVVPSNQEIDFPGIEDSAPYIGRYVTNELEDGGISPEEAEFAGRHIGTVNSLSLAFDVEREPQEIKLDYDSRFGESVIIIDPEFAISQASKSRTENDYHMFNQQVLPQEGWRKIDQIITETRNDTVKRASESSKEWNREFDRQLPENWRETLPEERMLDTEL